MSVISVMSQNLQHGGRFEFDGSPSNRWPQLVDLITGVAPDILLVQEAREWLDDSQRAVAEAEERLGMRVLVAPSRVRSHTGVLFRTDVFRWLAFETHYADQTANGFGAATLVHRETGVVFNAISAHLVAYSADQAAHEAQLMQARAQRRGGVGFVGGDINHFAIAGDPPNPDAVRPMNVASRWTTRSDGTLEPNRVVGHVFTRAKFVDVAAQLAQNTGDTTLLAPTGVGGMRVDQFWVSAALAPAIMGYRTVDPKGASDHRGPVMQLDLARLDASKAVAWG